MRVLSAAAIARGSSGERPGDRPENGLVIQLGDVNGHEGLAIVRALPWQPQPLYQRPDGFR
jgi:hypothetical protein